MESQEKIHEKSSKKKKNLTEKNGVVKMKKKNYITLVEGNI